MVLNENDNQRKLEELNEEIEKRKEELNVCYEQRKEITNNLLEERKKELIGKYVCFKSGAFGVIAYVKDLKTITVKLFDVTCNRKIASLFISYNINEIDSLIELSKEEFIALIGEKILDSFLSIKYEPSEKKRDMEDDEFDDEE